MHIKKHPSCRTASGTPGDLGWLLSLGSTGHGLRDGTTVGAKATLGRMEPQPERNTRRDGFFFFFFFSPSFFCLRCQSRQPSERLLYKSREKDIVSEKSHKAWNLECLGRSAGFSFLSLVALCLQKPLLKALARVAVWLVREAGGGTARAPPTNKIAWDDWPTKSRKTIGGKQRPSPSVPGPPFQTQADY